ESGRGPYSSTQLRAVQDSLEHAGQDGRAPHENLRNRYTGPWIPCSRLRSILQSLTRRSSRARVLRSSEVPISRATAVQDSHTLSGIISMILASVLRASIRCGSLQARSANLRKISTPELPANGSPTVSGRTTCERPGFTSVYPAGVAILSFSSEQVFRTSAAISVQFSI